MGNVSALRERPFFMSIEFTSVLLCSFVFKIMMGAKKYETFVRSLGEGAPEPKVRLKGRPGQPGLFLCQRCCSTSPKMRRFKPWYWVTDAAWSMFALQTSIGSMLSTHFALWYHSERVLVSMDSKDHQSKLCRSPIAFGFWSKAIQFQAWRRFKMVSKSESRLYQSCED